MELTPVETRILGCLLEKERITPENYPLTLNGLVGGCNQSTNRDPVVTYDERTVQAGLDGLRQKQLAMIVHTAGARVPKYRHRLPDQYNLSSQETALLCVLMLRGPQTPGELRSRAERLGGPASLAEVEAVLEELARGDHALVRSLPARLGQKERRYVQLLSGPYQGPEPESAPGLSASAPAPTAGATEPVAPPAAGGYLERLAAVEAEVATLKAAVSDLQNELKAFQRQFE
ncbi:MAG: YceH family protein [Verrucomicrobia bacterium]|nr:YceH family protein [Verrucomicrobiota bacterium]